MKPPRSPGSPAPTRAMNFARLLLLIAAASAAYLAWVSIRGGAVAGCGPSSDCDKVLQSRWAYWFEIPVSLPALGTYLALLTLTLLRPGKTGRCAERWQAVGVLALSLAIIGAATWFVGLQVFVIKGFCKFCMVAHTSGLIAAALLLRAAILESRGTGEGRIGRRSLTMPILSGLAAFGFLVVGQFFAADKQFEVKSTGMGNLGRAAPGPQLPVHEGRLLLDLAELPAFGAPEAPHVVVSLFDYSCPHCRTMHKVWADTQRRYGAQLAVVILPVPLSASCNDQLKFTRPEHREDCDYARLSLAVWRANRTAFAQFESWVLTPATPPPLTAATKYAQGLVGKDALNHALRDPWIDAQIRTNVAIYAENNRVMNSLKMPQAIVGRSVVIGSVRKPEDMDRLLAKELGIQPVQ